MRTTDRLTVPPDGRPFHEQPQWRNDFPIDVPQDEFVARRDFTKFLVLTSFAFVVGQWWIALENLLRARRGAPPIKRIAKLSEVPIGKPVTFEYTEPSILIRTSETNYIAFSQKCTHLGCAVKPEPESGRLFCPCHRGIFDMNGDVLAGPPRRPLPRITLEVRGDSIYATGIEVRA